MKNNWSIVEIGSLISYAIGGGWGMDDPTGSYIEEARVIRGTDIPLLKESSALISCVPLRYHKASNLRSRVLLEGDIVFEMAGGSKGQPVGRSLFINKNISSERAIAASFCKLIRPDRKNVVPKYLDYIFRYFYKKGVTETYQLQSTGISNFQYNPFLKYKISIPGLTVQQSIADVLSAYDDLIEVNTQKIKLLEEMAQAIYKEWFINFRFPGYKKVKMVDSLLGKIPDGWEVKTVKDYSGLITRGSSLKYLEDGGLPVLNQRCVREGEIVYEAIQYAEAPRDSKYILQENDIVVNSMGEGTLGRVSRNLSIIEDMIVHNCITLIRASSKSSPFFLYYYIKMHEKYFVTISNGSTGQTSLKPSEIKNLKVAYPSNEIIKLFGEAVAPMWKNIGNLKRLNNNLRETRDLLLPKLMSAEIEV